MQSRRQIVYNGHMDRRVMHEPWCRVPHPNAIMDCTCPASAHLSYSTTLESMSVDQYGVLYKAAPMPRHKIKAIRNKRHVLDPDDQRWWPKNKAGKPYDPRRHGYPPDWTENPYSGEGEYDVFDEQTGAPVQEDPRLRATGIDRLQREYQPPPPEILEARKKAPNFWEVSDVSNFDAQRWHTDPTYNPDEYTPEQRERARLRALTMTRPVQEQPYYPQQQQPQTAVVPTQYAHLPPQQQQQYYPAQGQPMTPHTQQHCRAPLLMDVPGAPMGSPPVVVECATEPHDQNQPHMAPIQARRASQTVYITWVDN